MKERQPLPVAGMALAVVTFVALLLLGFDWIIALAVLGVWIGSLLLSAGQPPDPPRAQSNPAPSIATMSDLLENSTVPMVVTQKNTIAVANRAARDLLGNHMVGQDVRVVFRQPGAIALLNENRDGSVTVRGLVRRQDIWGIHRQSVSDTMAIVELVNQTAEADISRAHTDFVANASHELRTPLASILGYVETLREGGDDLDEATSRRFLETIEREAKRLKSLISDLMSLSRIEAEKHDVPAEPVDLGPLIKRAAADAAGSDRADRTRIVIERPATILGDPMQLEQVIRNLVDNALKYSADQATVTVRLDRSDDDRARICVEDQGDGIAADQLPLLTRRFYRIDPGRSRASGGTGLGLAIVKHIVQRHLGRLDIHSQLGEGTRVEVWFPIAASHDESSSHARGRSAARVS